MTLCPSFFATQRDAIASAETIGSTLGGGVPIELGTITTTSQPFRAVVLEVAGVLPGLENQGQLVAASKAARELLFPDPSDERHSTPFLPHLSLMYEKHKQPVLAEAKAAALRALGSDPTLFDATRLVLVMTFGSAYQCWQEIKVVDLMLAAPSRSNQQGPAASGATTSEGEGGGLCWLAVVAAVGAVVLSRVW